MEGQASRAVAGLHVLGGFTKPFCTGVLLVGGAVSSNYGAEDSCVSPRDDGDS